MTSNDDYMTYTCVSCKVPFLWLKGLSRLIDKKIDGIILLRLFSWHGSKSSVNEFDIYHKLESFEKYQKDL